MEKRNVRDSGEERAPAAERERRVKKAIRRQRSEVCMYVGGHRPRPLAKGQRSRRRRESYQARAAAGRHTYTHAQDSRAYSIRACLLVLCFFLFFQLRFPVRGPWALEPPPP
ncbi:hypothetical protein CDD83_6612 [Cordyceps sp. RAO-2017]|nr:hypothetical protein CDD83_6612 [Cordyceps sp. RAO-2017]